MISALSSAATGMQNASAAIEASANRIANVEVGPRPEEMVAQAQEVVESYQDAGQAAAEVQVSLLRDGLDMAVDLNAELVDMVMAANAYTANTAVADQSQKMIDLIV